MKTRPNNNKIRWSIETKYSRMNQVKFSGSQPLKNLKEYGLLKQTISSVT